MAKKKKGKKKGKRQPPRAASRPPAAPRPQGGESQTATESRAEVATNGAPAERTSKARERRLRAEELRRRRERRKRLRTILITVGVVLVLGALLSARFVMNSRATAQFNQMAAAAGCGSVQSTSTAGANDHLAAGGTTDYDTSPPTSGKHAPSTLSARVLPPSQPLSEEGAAPGGTIYEAVHSMEHGAVIVWYSDLSDDQFDELDKAMREELKVIVAPYDKLSDGTKVALTVWGKLLECKDLDIEVVEAFVERFRDKTGPENGADI